MSRYTGRHMMGNWWRAACSWREQVPRRQRERKTAGQAIVELALSLTLITMLLGAAVDLGLAYRAHQTLINAAAEASSYLDQNPSANCGKPNCNPFHEADRLARERFRTEQGDTIRGVGSTLDLNGNGMDDLIEPGGGAALLASLIQIDVADSTQVDDTGGGGFQPNGTFNPASADNECQQRVAEPNSSNTSVTSCYIVIRAQMAYKPFVMKVLLGETMTIRATSVRRIVTTF